MFENVLKVVKREYEKNGRDLIWAFAFLWFPILCFVLIGISIILNYIVQNATNLLIGAIPAVVVGWLLVWVNKKMGKKIGDRIKSA